MIRIVEELEGMESEKIMLGERSGPPPTEEVMEDKGIYEQEQINWATELGLGVKGPEDIELKTPDRKSERKAQELRSILTKG